MYYRKIIKTITLSIISDTINGDLENIKMSALLSFMCGFQIQNLQARVLILLLLVPFSPIVQHVIRL